jgi:hypothetical protein
VKTIGPKGLEVRGASRKAGLEVGG